MLSLILINRIVAIDIAANAVQSCLTLVPPWTAACLVLHHFLELAQTHVPWVCDAIQPSHPLSSPPPPTFKFSQYQSLFQWVSSSHRMAKVLELSFSISPYKEYSGLISFRMDWLDLLAVQGTLKSLLQHHSSKTSILQGSGFKCLLISRLQSPSAVIFEPKKTKSVTLSIASPSICHEVMGLDAMILLFWMLSFKPTFSLSSFTFIKKSLVLLHFLP